MFCIHSFHLSLIDTHHLPPPPPLPSSSVWLWSTKLASLVGIEAYSFSFSVVFCLYGFCACACVCVWVFWLSPVITTLMSVCVLKYFMCRMMMSFFHVQPSEVAANLLKIKMCSETVEKMVSLVGQVSLQTLPLSLFLEVEIVSIWLSWWFCSLIKCVIWIAFAYCAMCFPGLLRWLWKALMEFLASPLSPSAYFRVYTYRTHVHIYIQREREI